MEGQLSSPNFDQPTISLMAQKKCAKTGLRNSGILLSKIYLSTPAFLQTKYELNIEGCSILVGAVRKFTHFAFLRP